MRGFLKNIVYKIKQISIIILFIVTAGLVTFLLPREAKFKYEYNRGNPWLHDDLTAPFQFSIYKTDAKLQAERDTILKDLNYYFNYSSDVGPEMLVKFRNEFEKNWVYYTLKEYRISSEESYTKHNRYFALRKLQADYFGLLYDLLKEVYDKGIMEYPDYETTLMTDNSDAVLVKGIDAEHTKISSFYTAKLAYQHIKQKLMLHISEDESRQIARYQYFFDNLNIDNYIEVNVTYDMKTTEQEKEERLTGISQTENSIKEGELIISKGEIVTQEKYQVLESLKKMYSLQKGNVDDVFVRLGKFLLILIYFTVSYLFLYTFRREVLRHFVKTVFILFMQLLFVLAAYSLMNYKDYIYIIPFTILPIILRIFYDERLAFFVHVMTILIVGLFAPNSYEFVVLNIIAGMVAILSLTNLYQRSRFLLSAVAVFMTYVVVFFGITVTLEGSFSQFPIKFIRYFALNGLLILLSFLLIYVFEKLFNFLSDTTLMELADTNQPLLRKLAELAPGTFQHSMQVANIAEEVVLKLGGNPLLVRTGALYHDIGKIASPEFFTENQDAAFNPHNKLDYKSSAKKIIDHIYGGVELAKKHSLPDPIIDFIKTHQGTATVHYFFRLYAKENEDGQSERTEFQYPGPRPQTKEQVILMMSDAIEAASRSLTEYSEDSIDKLVEGIVNTQLNEGQYEEADITFKEVFEAKEIIKEKLHTIYHARIAYPKEVSKE